MNFQLTYSFSEPEKWLKNLVVDIYVVKIYRPKDSAKSKGSIL